MKLGAHTQSKWMDIVYLMLNLECEDETICHHVVGAVKKNALQNYFLDVYVFKYTVCIEIIADRSDVLCLCNM